MSAPPMLNLFPLQPLNGGTVQAMLISDASYAGTQVTFTLLETLVTSTAYVDDSGQATSPAMTLGTLGTYTLQATVGGNVLAQTQFNTT